MRGSCVKDKNFIVNNFADFMDVQVKKKSRFCQLLVVFGISNICYCCAGVKYGNHLVDSFVLKAIICLQKRVFRKFSELKDIVYIVLTYHAQKCD